MVASEVRTIYEPDGVRARAKLRAQHHITIQGACGGHGIGLACVCCARPRARGKAWTGCPIKRPRAAWRRSLSFHAAHDSVRAPLSRSPEPRLPNTGRPPATTVPQSPLVALLHTEARNAKEQPAPLAPSPSHLSSACTSSSSTGASPPSAPAPASNACHAA